MYHIRTSWTTVRFNKQPVCVIVKKKTLENSLNNSAFTIGYSTGTNHDFKLLVFYI